MAAPCTSFKDSDKTLSTADLSTILALRAAAAELEIKYAVAGSKFDSATISWANAARC